MAHDPSYVTEVLLLLHQTKKAYTITDISKELGHDRRTISNILNILHLSGKVGMNHHGQKKKYFIEDTLQNSPKKSASPHFLIVLNSNLTIRWANSESIGIARVSMKAFLGKRLDILENPILNNFAIMTHLSTLQKDDTCTFEELIVIGRSSVTYLYTLANITVSANEQNIFLTGLDVTVVKHIEQEIIRNEQKITILTQNIPGAVFRRHLLTNQIEFFNSSFQAFSGYLSPDSTRGHLNSIDACILPDEREQYINTLQLSLATDTSYEVEYQIRTRKGHQCYLLERGLPIKDSAGDQIYIDGFILDITERKKIEAALQESEERFKLVADLAPVGIYITDTMGVCKFANQEWCRQTGLTPEEATERGWLIGLHADDRDMTSSMTGKTERMKGLWGYQYSFLSKTGEEVWVHTTTAELKDQNGEVIGYIGCNTDITERKQLEEKIMEKKEEFQFAAENSPGILFRFDSISCETEFYSDIDPKSKGFHPEDLFRIDNHSEGSLFLLHDREELHAARRASLETGEEYEIIYQIRGIDGRIHSLLERGKAFLPPSGIPQYINGIILDTSRKKKSMDIVQHRARLYLQSGHSPSNKPPGKIPLTHAPQPDQNDNDALQQKVMKISDESADSNQKYRDLFDTLPVGSVTLDLNGIILETNPAGAALLCRDDSSPTGRDIRWYMADESLPDFRKFLQAFQSTDAVRSCQAHIIRDDMPPHSVILKGVRAKDRMSKEYQVLIVMIEI